jgi:hypothetical protein
VSFSPIAIVGQGCVLPGAASPEALAALVAAKRNAVGRPPAGRFRLSGEQALGSPEWSIDRPWTEAGGYVTGFESVFSVDGFLIEPEVVWGMDPAFRWLLHAAREALRPVGHDGKSARAGLIIGNLSFPTATMARFAESVWLGEHAAAIGGPARPDATESIHVRADGAARGDGARAGRAGVRAGRGVRLVALRDQAGVRPAARRIGGPDARGGDQRGGSADPARGVLGAGGDEQDRAVPSV